MATAALPNFHLFFEVLYLQNCLRTLSIRYNTEKKFWIIVQMQLTNNLVYFVGKIDGTVPGLRVTRRPTLKILFSSKCSAHTRKS